MNELHIRGLTLGDGVPRICVPIVGKTEEDIIGQAEQAVPEKPDLLEWRADFFEGWPDAERTADAVSRLYEAACGIPILYTFRSAAEGGESEAYGRDYASLLIQAASKKEVAWVDVEACRKDVEAYALVERLHEQKAGVIASAHFFSETPDRERRNEILKTLQASGADVLKLAVMPHTAADVLDLLSWTEEKARSMETPIVTMAMGGLGMLSRISGYLTGSALTFGTVGKASAPGQLPVKDMKRIFSGFSSSDRT
ncbi:MAG: type I 3-dehydroquinate dehydratase [Eubacterium sp.]|nr:type I 3-dehydroquinate dehydratase [Eubacterium sp.]